MLSQPASLVRFLAASTAVLALASCAAHVPHESPAVTQNPPTARAATAPRAIGESAAVIAVRQVGTPYRYGGNDRDGFDCSGLVHFAYSQAGKQLPRTTAALWSSMQPVGEHDLRVGDVLFFRIAGKVSHVGMYVGSRRFVHAPSSGREVTIAELDSAFYRRAFLRGGRPR